MLDQIVKQHSLERYLSALFVPDHQRTDVLAVYAFDAEVAKIPFVVSEPQIGEIRMQWWVDTLDAIYAGETVDHPVAQALAAAIKSGRLPKESLRNLVLARTRELYADQMPSLNDLEGYLGETRSAVIQMAAQVLMQGRAQGIATAAGLGGVAQGIVELLTQLPRLPHGGKHLLPEGVDLLDHAERRLSEFSLESDKIPLETRAAFLPLATLQARIKRLKKKGFGHGISPLRTQWLIWRAK
jgi:15-cis-phytoene synthase